MTLNAPSATRYEVSPGESSLEVEARSTFHPVRASVKALAGYVQAAWDADGTLAASPEPAMHVEFPVDRVSSGNALQDREMLKMIDARRFPKVAADLRGIAPTAAGRYQATGDVTLAGRVRRYQGEFSIAGDGGRVSVEGELSVDVRDFGIVPPSLLVLKVDPILRIRLRLVARKAA
ncbi:MAG TPA: YceI family protein [Candidatus Tumulicola sp.]|nr:YceI family protein [Candidatus Tumulicola sp.]